MTQTDIVTVADVLAEKYHKQQKRRDGKPYKTHVDACAMIAEHLYDPTLSYDTGLPLGKELPMIKAVCKTHDILEDCMHMLPLGEDTLRDEILNAGIPLHLTNPWIVALNTLNKNNYLTYAVYIMAISYQPLPTIAKLCDLEHNTSDLPKGHMRDKYELAQYILTHKLT